MLYMSSQVIVISIHGFQEVWTGIRTLFKTSDRRSGEICNACVLLVKRWKKLPPGTQRDWKHVVDARAGPGTKSVKITSSSRRKISQDPRTRILTIWVRMAMVSWIRCPKVLSWLTFSPRSGDDNMDCLRRVGSPDRSDYSDDEEEEYMSDDEFESSEGKRRLQRTSRCPSRRPSKRINSPSDWQ